MASNTIKSVDLPEIDSIQNIPQQQDSLPRTSATGSTLGTTEVRIQGRYLVNDGENDRVLIGKFFD